MKAGQVPLESSLEVLDSSGFLTKKTNLFPWCFLILFFNVLFPNAVLSPSIVTSGIKKSLLTAVLIHPQPLRLESSEQAVGRELRIGFTVKVNKRQERGEFESGTFLA